MLTIPSFVAFFLPVPALRNALSPDDVQRRKRRAVSALHLPEHLLKDVGLDDLESPADDPRWVRQFELDR